MTVVAGRVKGGVAWLAADRLTSWGGVVSYGPKLVTMDGAAYALSGAPLLSDIIRRAEVPAPSGDPRGWLFDQFVPAVRGAVVDGKWSSQEWAADLDTELLIAVGGRLFGVSTEWSLHEHDYWAIGSGREVALGVLYAMRDAPADEAVRTAVSAAVEHVTTCGGAVDVVAVAS